MLWAMGKKPLIPPFYMCLSCLTSRKMPSSIWERNQSSQSTRRQWWSGRFNQAFPSLILTPPWVPRAALGERTLGSRLRWEANWTYLFSLLSSYWSPGVPCWVPVGKSGLHGTAAATRQGRLHPKSKKQVRSVLTVPLTEIRFSIQKRTTVLKVRGQALESPMVRFK